MDRQALNATVTARALGLSIFACLAFVSLEADAAEYEVRVLDPLPEGFLHRVTVFEPPVPRLFGPNRSGELGENATNESVNNTFGLRWNSDGEVSVLEVPEGTSFSAGYDINRRDDIVGWYSGGGAPPIAAIWHRDGTRTDLPSLADDGRAQAYSINYRGTAVGFGGGPVVWDKRGGITELPLPDGTSAAVPWSISDNGLIFWASTAVRYHTGTDNRSMVPSRPLLAAAPAPIEARRRVGGTCHDTVSRVASA